MAIFINGNLNFFEIYRKSCKYNAHVDHQNNNGNTALHQAILGANAEIIPMLIAAGANLIITNNKNHTPLQEAHEFYQENGCKQEHFAMFHLIAYYCTVLESAHSRAQHAALVIASATHPRLGCRSLLASVPQLLLQSIANLNKELEECDARSSRL